MGIYKNVLPFPETRIHRKPGKRDTKLKARRDQIAQERAVVHQWFAQRKAEKLPLSRPRFYRGLKDGRVVAGVGGVWVSKRALHEDCVASSETTLSWGKFLLYFRELQPSPLKSHISFNERPASGLLIARYTEVCIWFPGWRGTLVEEF